MTATECPFLPLCERDLTGGPDALGAHEQDDLAKHLAEGCPVCEGRIGADLESGTFTLDAALDEAVAYAAEAMEPGRLQVLARVRQGTLRDERGIHRRARRRLLRLLFYVTNLAAVTLLAVAYVGTRAGATIRRLQAQELAAAAEVRALEAALVRYVRDGGALPTSEAEWLAALRSHRPNGRIPYYRFDADRLTSAGYLDPFGRPYRVATRPGAIRVYSLGMNGVPDTPEPSNGRDDDLGRWFQEAR